MQRRAELMNQAKIAKLTPTEELGATAGADEPRPGKSTGDQEIDVPPEESESDNERPREGETRAAATRVTSTRTKLKAFWTIGWSVSQHIRGRCSLCYRNAHESAENEEHCRRS